MRLSSPLVFMTMAYATHAKLLSTTEQLQGTSSHILPRLNRAIGSQHDLASIQSLSETKQDLLCLGTSTSSSPSSSSSSSSSGSIDKTALKFALGASANSSIDSIHAYLQGRCFSSSPATNSRFGIFGIKAENSGGDAKSAKEDKLCGALEKADAALDAVEIGNFAEALGFNNPFSKEFGKFASRKCGVTIHPHPNPSKPVPPERLKIDPCQAAIFFHKDGSFEIPQKCQVVPPEYRIPRKGQEPQGYGTQGSDSRGYESQGYGGPPQRKPKPKPKGYY